MHISNDLSCVLQNDLQIYSPKELESIFINIIIPNKPNSILGTIYKHPSMKPHRFKNKFLEPLLSKIKAKGKATFLAGDFNFNLIKCNQNKGTAEFLEHLFSSNFILHINLPISCISLSAYHSVPGNLTTSLSDHLPQFIILKKLQETL